jgi:hypothetical protein
MDDMNPQGIDLGDEEIPVINSTGETVLIKGANFIGKVQAVSVSSAVTDAAKSAAEDKEIAAVQKKMVQSAALTGNGGLFENLVEKVAVDSGFTFKDDDTRRRFKTIAELFFRDLRDELETKSKLTMSVTSGGMGMDDAAADRVLAGLKIKALEDRAGGVKEKMDEKTRYVAERSRIQLTQEDTEEKKEQEVLESRFVDLMKKAKKEVVSTEQKSPRIAEIKISTPVASSTTPPANAPAKIIPVVAVPLPGVTGESATIQVPKKEMPLPPSNLPVAPLSATPPRAATSPPIASAPPSVSATMVQQTEKPLMSDIKFTQKLMGPIEELRALTLVDFRRLSKDPREATLKLKDKMDILENQGFELKTQGMKAWHESEPNRLYLDLLRQSLEGKQLDAVIAEKQTKGEATLTKPEFDAIMVLNRQLRFG